MASIEQVKARLPVATEVVGLGTAMTRLVLEIGISKQQDVLVHAPARSIIGSYGWMRVRWC